MNNLFVNDEKYKVVRTVIKPGKKVDTKGLYNRNGVLIDDLIKEYFDNKSRFNRGETFGTEGECNPLLCCYWEKKSMGGLFRTWIGCISPCFCFGSCPLLCGDPREYYNNDGTHQLIDDLSIDFSKSPKKEEMN